MESLSLIDYVNLTFKKFNKQIALIYQPHDFYYHYNDLMIESNLICQELLKLNITYEYIGILNDLEIPFVTSLVGILKAKLSFVFLKDDFDPLINKIPISLIITKSGTLFTNKNVECFLSIRLKYWKIEFWRVLLKNVSFTTEKIAYAINTSGSTGNAKIVQVSQASIVPNIIDLKERLQISSKDVIPLASPLTFDPSIIEIFLALFSGAKLLIISPSFLHANFNHLFSSDKPENSITFLQITPSVFINLNPEIRSHILENNSPVCNLVFGGEPFPNNFIKNLKQSFNKTNIFNIYGITEVSCWASLERFDMSMKEMDLGQPLSFTEFKIYDNTNGKEIFGENCKGELWIGSEKRICLIDDESSEIFSRKKVFRATGDVVEKRNNRYYYVGRRNAIVKRFGHRVSLSKIEQISRSHSDVENSLCVWDSEQRTLNLYVSPENVNIQNVGRTLTSKLHPSHYPDEIKALAKLPLSNHGKLLRRKQGNSFSFLCKKYLGSHLKWNCSFRANGGDSIKCLQIIQELKNSPSNLLLKLLGDSSLDEIRKYLEVDDHRPDGNKVPKKNFNPSSLKIEFSWKFNLEKCIDATPAIYQKSSSDYIIIVGSHSHKLGLFFYENNSLTNSQNVQLEDRIEASACLSLCGRFCYIGCYDHSMYAVIIETAKILWKYKTGDIIKCKAVLTNNGENLLFGSYDRFIYCIQAMTGELNWKTSPSEASIYASLCLINANNSAISVTLDGTIACVDQSKGELIWKERLSKPIFSTPVIHDNDAILALVTGEVVAMDIFKGETKWTFQASNNIFSSIIKSKEYIYFGSHDHNIYCLDKENGHLIWRTHLESAIFATPFLFTYNSFNLLAVASIKGFLYLLDPLEGAIVTEYKIEGELFSSPIVASNHIFIGSRDNHLYCLGIT